MHPERLVARNGPRGAGHVVSEVDRTDREPLPMLAFRITPRENRASRWCVDSTPGPRASRDVGLAA